MSEYSPNKFEELLGKVLTEITNHDNDRLIFKTSTGEEYRLFHRQDCCESVRIEEIIGELDSLIGSPILLAEEVSSVGVTPEWVTPPEYPDSYTWTFYKLATNLGYATIRWLGESNGYYSESVDFVKIK
jgi:hypothetical protein